MKQLSTINTKKITWKNQRYYLCEYKNNMFLYATFLLFNDKNYQQISLIDTTEYLPSILPGWHNLENENRTFSSIKVPSEISISQLTAKELRWINMY